MTQLTDHDLLIRLDERTGGVEARLDAILDEIRGSHARIRADIIGVRSDSQAALKDHEDKHGWNVTTALSIIAIVGTVVVGLVALWR